MLKTHVLCDDRVAQERVERGRVFLQRMQAKYPELAGHDVKDTPADGMCFLHAVLLQLGLDYKPLFRSRDLHRLCRALGNVNGQMLIVRPRPL